jgi:DNA-damage-inducible protein D
MNDLELIFSMLGEASTTEIVKTQNPKGFIQNKKAAKQGGAVAGNARRELESRTGKKWCPPIITYQKQRKTKN